mmetsp:Transcript_300/g.491  ORF Transcript_300/g.491 Transcript_300/m.491 type:complete len:80 (+) Transcript_300:107-346(+)
MDEKNKESEPEIAVTASAVPAPGSGAPQASDVPAGHSRFYCEKCHAPYDLPDRATSWRCANCSTFNSITPGECEWCSIL